jgi:regulatory protein
MDSSILKKAANFCVYQERTQDEVRKKLKEWKIYDDEAEEMIAWLIVENYINEERFAKAFAGGKFRVKHWGKLKIVFELKGRKISAYCIKEALKEISDEDYFRKIVYLINKKSEDLSAEKSDLERNHKISKYLIGKGFETDLVWSALKK